MGCGGSVETNSKPLQAPPQTQQEFEEETPKPSQLEPIAEQNDEGKATDEPKNKKKPIESSRVSQKSTDKVARGSEKGSPSKGSPNSGDVPKGLRNSSLKSSRASSSSKKKLQNPEGGLGTTEAIEQENLGRSMAQKPSQKTIKKVKSVKNNKDLSDLIKVYGL